MRTIIDDIAQTDLLEQIRAYDPMLFEHALNCQFKLSPKINHSALARALGIEPNAFRRRWQAFVEHARSLDADGR